MKKNEKALVTGASGFIGGHLVKRLEDQGLIVTKLSRDEFHDLNGLSTVTKGQDYIFNLAAYGSQRGEKNPWQTVVNNIIIPLHFLQGDPQNKATIFCGSSSEYGLAINPMSELNPLHPTTIYAGSKAAISIFIEGAVRQTGYPAAIARPFSIYGPNEKDTRLIPTIIRSCLTGEEMKLDDTANHDWLYVEDLVDGLILVADKISVTRGAAVNFGSGKQMTNRQIVHIIEELTGKKANITGTYPPSNYDSRIWEANINRARGLGWEPKINIVRGLQKTIDFYEKKYTKIN